MSDKERWLTALNTAYRLGWHAGKDDAQAAVTEESAEHAEVIAWIAYNRTPDLSDLIPNLNNPKEPNDN